MKVKISVLYLSISALLIIFGCSKKPISKVSTSNINPYTAEVNFLSKENNGIVFLNSAGYGNNEEEAIIDAQKNVFNVLLFKGIPGTDFNIPLVENETQSRTQNAKYYNSFFEQNYYKNYIMSYEVVTPLTKHFNTNKIFINIRINSNSLRKNLEQNNIIRKFGY